MSSFYCETCGALCEDSPRGYVSGCEHYPTEITPSGSRSLRRHHSERMKAKARFIAGVIWRYAQGDTKNPAVVETMVKNADHLKACSCQMCCNERRSKTRRAQGKTYKEQLADQEVKDAQL